MAKYVETLLRHWVRFSILLLIAPLVLGSACVLIFRTYQGSTSVWVDPPNYLGQSVAPSDWNQYLTPAQNQADTLQQLVSTQAFDYKIGDRLASTGAVRSQAEQARIVASIPTSMKVTVDGSHLVTLIFSYENKAELVSVLKLTVDLFEEHEVQVERDQQQLSTTFLSGQLKTAQAKLATAGQQLAQYLAQHPDVHLSPNGQDTGIVELDQLVHQVQLDRDETTQVQTEYDQAQFLGAAAQQIVRTNTQIVDDPHITKGGIMGDGSSVKRALIACLACASLGLAYLVILVWADKTARDTKELEHRMSVPVLTTIPIMRLTERF